jgi:hypothetical protein
MEKNEENSEGKKLKMMNGKKHSSMEGQKNRNKE